MSKSGANRELENFLTKAINNNFAEKMKAEQAQELEQDYQERKEVLHYVE